MTSETEVTDYGAVPERKPTSKPRGEVYGYGCMLVGCLFFDVISTIARACVLFHGLTPANVIFVRGVSHMVYCLIASFLFYDPKEVFHVPREMRTLLVVRGILGGIGVAMIYKALSLVPLGIIVSVFFMDPIFTIMIAAIFLHERISFYEGCAAVLSIIGVVIVANPTFDLPQNLPPSYVLGLVIQLGASTLFAVQVVMVRALSKEVHYMTITMSMGIPIALIGWGMGGADLPGFTFGVFFVLVGSIFGFAAFLLIHKALLYSRASTAALIQTVDLPLGYAFGVVFLNEIPHVMSLVGSALVLVACAGVALDSRRKEKEQLVKEVVEKEEVGAAV